MALHHGVEFKDIAVHQVGQLLEGHAAIEHAVAVNLRDVHVEQRAGESRAELIDQLVDKGNRLGLAHVERHDPRLLFTRSDAQVFVLGYAQDMVRVAEYLE